MEWVEFAWELIVPYLTLDRLLNVVGAGGLIFGLYQWWMAGERQLAAQLDDFLDREHEKLKVVRDNISKYRVKTGTPFLGDYRVHSNRALDDILLNFKGKSLFKIEQKIDKVLGITSLREAAALEHAEKQREQKTVAHILLGARLVRRGEHRAALAQFNNALELNEHDAEALEYAGHQHIRLGSPQLALERFGTLVEVAQTRIGAADTNMERAPGRLLLARAHRGRGLAYEKLGNPRNAFRAYTDASEVFPVGHGALIDLADIHQLRGRVAIIAGFTIQAEESLTKAHEIFSDLIREDGEHAGMARKGLVLVEEALLRLNDLQNEDDENNIAIELALEDA